jgi:hypothetical protein
MRCCRPVFFKIYVTDRNQVIVVISCCVVVTISLLFGYLSSYMNRAICTTSFCAVMSSYGLRYSNYNSAIVIIFPVFAFILNIFTYTGARRLRTHADMKKELKLVLITLIITFVDVLLIACPNIVLFLSYNKYLSISGANLAYLYVFFCCNSAINLFVYIFLKRDFRNHLLMIISRGILRPFLKTTNEISMTRPTRRVVPSNGSSLPIRRSVQLHHESMPNVMN